MLDRDIYQKRKYKYLIKRLKTSKKTQLKVLVNYYFTTASLVKITPI